MSHRVKEYLKYIVVVGAIALYSLHAPGCANTSGGPTGGPKDTIPPVLLKTMPDSIRTQFPRLKGKVYITFDEYVQLKNPSSEVVLSPPMQKKPTTSIKKKSVVVAFNDTLKEDQTYTINFGNAISDVNEGNPYPNYVYTFSTGDYIDSLIISGTVMDYQTLLPQKGVLVSLYDNPRDSCALQDMPVAVTKTDDWGYFCATGLKEIPYTLFAIEDKNNNFLYDKGGEMGGFLIQTITPHVVYNDTLPQVKMYDMKDTVGCLSRPSEADIYIFKEQSDVQYLTNSGRISERECFLKFSTKGVRIDTFLIKGVYSDQIIKQFNADGDSLTFWINDRRTIPDTLDMRLCYWKTDSTGVLQPFGQDIKLIKPFDKTKVERYKRRNTYQTRTYVESLTQKSDGTSLGTEEGVAAPSTPAGNTGQNTTQKREDLLEFDLTAKGESVENLGIDFLFKVPLISSLWDSIHFTCTTPRQITTDVKFKVERDSTNILHYVMRAQETYKVGNDYQIYIPFATFTDINSFTNDSTVTKFSLPTNDKLSSITLEISNVKGERYIVELVNEKRDRIYLRYDVTEDKDLLFPYLNAGNYSFRITQDKNHNGKLDVGDLIKRIPPEKARLLRLEDGSAIIKLKEQTDLTQSVDLERIFEDESAEIASPVEHPKERETEEEEMVTPQEEGEFNQTNEPENNPDEL